MFLETLIRSYGPLQNDSGFRHSRFNDFRIIDFLREALVEEIALTPSLQRGLHGRGGHSQIKET